MHLSWLTMQLLTLMKNGPRAGFNRADVGDLTSRANGEIDCSRTEGDGTRCKPGGLGETQAKNRSGREICLGARMRSRSLAPTSKPGAAPQGCGLWPSQRVPVQGPRDCSAFDTETLPRRRAGAATALTRRKDRVKSSGQTTNHRTIGDGLATSPTLELLSISTPNRTRRHRSTRR